MRRSPASYYSKSVFLNYQSTISIQELGIIAFGYIVNPSTASGQCLGLYDPALKSSCSRPADTAAEKSSSRVVLRSMPPIMSVHQCTPQYSLPATVTRVTMKHTMRTSAPVPFSKYLSEMIIVAIITVIMSMVWDDGKDASGAVSPGIMTGL